MTRALTYFSVLFLSIWVVACNNPCRKLDCLNDGFCHEGECICQKWYSGDECELKFNRNYEGTYYGVLTVENGMRVHSSDSLILTAQDLPNRLESNIGYYIELDADSNLIVPRQIVNVSGGNYEFTGTGKYEIDWIRIEYTMTALNDGMKEFIHFEGSRVQK